MHGYFILEIIQGILGNWGYNNNKKSSLTSRKSSLIQKGDKYFNKVHPRVADVVVKGVI